MQCNWQKWFEESFITIIKALSLIIFITIDDKKYEKIHVLDYFITKDDKIW